MGKLFSYLEKNILSLGVISLLIFIPLYPKFPLFAVPGTYVAIRIEDFWVMAVFLIWLFLDWRQGWPTFRQRASRLILVYFLAGMVSLVSALTVTRMVVPHIAFLHFLRRVQYMSCFFIAFAATKKRQGIKSFVYAFLISIIGVLIFGVGQKYLNWPVISTMNEEFSKGMVLYLSEWTRISSTFAGHYDLAAFMVLAFSLFLGFILGVKRKLLKLLGLVLVMAVFYILTLTASRISFAAYLIAAVFTLFVAQKKQWIAPLVFLSVFFIFMSADLGQRYAATFNLDLSFFSSRPAQEERKIVLAPTPTPTPKPKPSLVKEAPLRVVVTPTPKKLRERRGLAAIPVKFPEPEPVQLATQRSGEIRFKVEWPRAVRAFLKNPLLGTGYSSVTLATDNDYLRALAETGLLGLGALVLIFLEIAAKFLVFIRKTSWCFEKALVIGLAGGILGFLANAIFIDVFEASKVAFIFWLLAGMMMGMIKKLKIKS